MKLTGIFEDQGQMVGDQVREIISEVGHEADTQGAPDEVLDKRYPVDAESAWGYGVQWALDRIDELLTEREL